MQVKLAMHLSTVLFVGSAVQMRANGARMNMSGFSEQQAAVGYDLLVTWRVHCSGCRFGEKVSGTFILACRGTASAGPRGRTS